MCSWRLNLLRVGGIPCQHVRPVTGADRGPRAGRGSAPSGGPTTAWHAGQAFTSLNPGDTLLDPGAGMAVFAGWVVLAIVGAAIALKRRDA